ncbi:MAG TPA: methylenetetrahydrofolate reductase [Burkholderiales bacterium]|nr:methylenetetrahydrofolate reductase [Burkholderiales bacterium]
MSSPASAIELRLQARIAELVTGGSLEISPREMHRAAEVAALLPKDTCVYVPSLPGLPLSRTLEMVAALRAAGLDPVPHVSARRIVDRNEFKSFLKEATSRYGVHRVLVIGGDEPKAKGPYNDSLEVLREGVLAEAGIREIGVSGYPEGHPRIDGAKLERAFADKVAMAREQGLGLYVVTQFSFAPKRIVDFCAALSRSAPNVSVYVGIAGPSDPAALLRYAQRCGVSTSLRALRNLGSGIARLVVHTDPQEQVAALGGYLQGRDAGNVVGVHLYSFGGAVRTASWMRARISA